MKENITDIAVIFKTRITGGITECIPVKVAYGTYIDDKFIDKDNVTYSHIITGVENYGFCFPSNINTLRKNYPSIPLPVIMINIKKKITQRFYSLGIDKKTKAPALYGKEKRTLESSIILDEYIIEYYLKNHFIFLSQFLTPEAIELLREEENITGSNIIRASNSIIEVSKLYSEITSYVIGQDEPIKKILTAIWEHYSGYSDETSRNILINGSTGVGKTEIFRVLSKILDIPCHITSATGTSATGYIGKSVEDMLISLLNKAKGDIESAENGILVIDEVDKLAQSNSLSSVNQRDVQEELLKLIEGSTFNISWNKKEYTFDTTKLLVIAMGSFSRINLKEERKIGFENSKKENLYRTLTTNDMLENGMIPEFIGRFPILISMNELALDDYLKILTQGKKSPLLLHQKLLKAQGISLVIPDDVKLEIAKEAAKSEFGARSLDAIIERMLSNAMFEIASNPGVFNSLEVTSPAEENSKKYKLIRTKSNI